MPHALSNMSAPDPKPERHGRGHQAIKKFKIVNRFLQSDAAGIKPGEDAGDLTDRTGYRRQKLSRNRTGSPAAALRFQSLHSPYKLRQNSISSEVSGASNISNGSSSTNVTHGSSSGSNSSCASVTRRTGGLQLQHARQHHHPNGPFAFDATNPETTRFSGTHDQSAGPIFPTLEESGRAMTTISESTVVSASTGITLPDLEIDPSLANMQQSQYRCLQLCDAGTTPSDAHITESPLGSPGAVSHGPFTSMLPPPATHSDTAYFPANHSFVSNVPFPVPCSAPMSRESSSQGANTGTGHTDESPYEQNEETVSNNNNREPSEPISSAPSSDPQSTQPSEKEEKDDSDDASSEQDSESPSDDSRNSPDPLQRDFLEEILRPVKHHLLQRLMLYVANNGNLGISLPTTSLFGCTGTVKTESPDPLTALPFMQKEVPKREETPPDHDSNRSVAAGPKEAPASTDPGVSSSRANGKRPFVPASSQPGRADMGANRKRKAGGSGSPGDDDDGNDSDDEDERRRAPKLHRSSSPHHGPPDRRRIACPYFKRDPGGQPLADACFRNGFRDITKMKEHLERVHDHSIQCPRCFKVFKEQNDVAAHLRVSGDQMCAQVQEQPRKDVYDATKAGKLKERMRNQSVEDKWKTIWQILFPSDQDHMIPPPWWVHRDELLGLSFYARYEEYLRNDLPRRFERGFAALVDQFFCLDPFRDLIENTVLECMEGSYADFRDREAAGPAPAAPRQHEADAPAAVVPAAASSIAGPSTSTTTHNFAAPPAAGPNSINPSLTMIDTTANHYFQPGSLRLVPDDSTPVFRVHPSHGQPVDAPHVPQHAAAAPMLDPPVPAQLEQPGNPHDMMNSYLSVGRDGSAAHTPMSQSPNDQWSNIGSNSDFDDYTSVYYGHFSG